MTGFFGFLRGVAGGKHSAVEHSLINFFFLQEDKYLQITSFQSPISRNPSSSAPRISLTPWDPGGKRDVGEKGQGDVASGIEGEISREHKDCCKTGEAWGCSRSYSLLKALLPWFSCFPCSPRRR